jgi:DNA-binding NarL/FixJ family response regulator
MSEHDGTEILVVEDDHRMASVAERALRQYGNVRLASSLAQARSWIGARRFTCAIVDIGLPDGSGLEFVEELLEHQPLVSVMVWTAILDREHVNYVQSLGAEYLVKPNPQQNLTAFVERARQQRAVGHEPLHHALDEAMRTYELTRREMDVLRLAVHGVARDEIAERLGIQIATAKSHIRALLQKTNHSSLPNLAREVLARALRIEGD